jgi:hypothetical protein
VIGRVGEFIRHRLQNYNPQVEVIPARRRGTQWSRNPQTQNPVRVGPDLMGPSPRRPPVRQPRLVFADAPPLGGPAWPRSNGRLRALPVWKSGRRDRCKAGLTFCRLRPATDVHPH